VSYFEFDMINSQSPAFLKLKAEVDRFILSIKSPIKKSILILGLKNTGRHSLAAYIQMKIKQLNGQDVEIKNLLDFSSQEISIVIASQFDEFDADQFEIIFTSIKLADRKEDIIALAEFSIQVLSLMNNRGRFILSEKSKEKLQAYSWPDNFSELESVIEQAVHLATKNVIEPEHLIMQSQDEKLKFSIGEKLENVERQYILQTLFFVEQNRTKAAEVLGISIRTLRNKLSQYRQEGYL